MFGRLSFLAILVITYVSAEVLKPEYQTEFTADKDFLLKQKKVFKILYHIGQPHLNQELYKSGQEYKLEEHADHFTNKDAVKEFLHRYEHGFLPQNAAYSPFYPQMRDETLSIYKLLYYAKDFDHFYKTALFLRNKMNANMFVYAFYLAVIHRPDTKYIRLPPLYETGPHNFYNTDLFEKVHHVKSFGKFEPKHSAGYDTYVIPYNYSGHYLVHEYDYEQRLNYFTEDIGLNNFYFFVRSEYPFFLKSSELGTKNNYRGEEFLYLHKNLFNRYYLERLSNDLGAVEEFDYHKTFYPGYYPSMSYPNGLPYPIRPWECEFPKHKYHQIHTAREYETRISQAIDSGYVFSSQGKMVKIYTPEGLNILGNLIEGNPDSVNEQYYGSLDVLSRNILGFNLNPITPYNTQPSALENLATSLRDPAFWRLNYRILDFYYRYKINQKPYKTEEIRFPEYKIENVDTDKLVTYFDYYDTTINNGLLVDNEKDAEAFLIQARQYRLNHKHFHIHLNVNAQKAGQAAIRIFLGPKELVNHKDAKFPDYYKYFYEMDSFIYNFTTGSNKISRMCHDFIFSDFEPEPSEVFWKKLTKAIETGEELKMQKRIYAFPMRLLLPKGRPEGMPYQLFVHISPVSEMVTYSSRIFGDAQVDAKAFGYPLDRPISNYEFHGPNFYFKDILIYHEKEHDMSATH